MAFAGLYRSHFDGDGSPSGALTNLAVCQFMMLQSSRAPRARGEARQPRVAHVNDGWTFSHAADDALSIDAAQQAFEIRIAARIVEHDRVFDCGRHAIVHQPPDGVEARFLVGAESIIGLQTGSEEVMRRAQRETSPKVRVPDRAK